MARLDDIKVIWNIIKSDLYDEIGNNLAQLLPLDRRYGCAGVPAGDFSQW